MKHSALAALAAFTLLIITTSTASACKPTDRCFHPKGEQQSTSQQATTVDPAALAVAVASWAMPFCYRDGVKPAEVKKFDQTLRQHLTGLHPLALDEGPSRPAPDHPEQGATMLSYTGNPVAVTAVYQALAARKAEYCVTALTAWMSADAKQVTAFTISFDGEP